MISPPDVDGVTANLRGMLNLADDPSSTGTEDWCILKDFLGFRLPHERNEVELVGDHSNNQRVPRSLIPSADSNPFRLQQEHPTENDESHSPCVSSHHHNPTPLAPVLSTSSAAPAATPLPSIATLVRNSPTNEYHSIHDHLPMTPAPVDLSATVKSCYSGRCSPRSNQQNSVFHSVSSPTPSVSPPPTHWSIVTNSNTISLPYNCHSPSSLPSYALSAAAPPPPLCSSTITTGSVCNSSGSAISIPNQFQRSSPQKTTSASLLRDLLVVGKPQRTPTNLDQARLGGLVRAGAMEHRWQDLASLLSIPSPDNGSSGHHSAQSPPSATMTPAANNTHHHHHHQPSPSVIHHPHPLYPTNDAHGTISPYSSGIPRGVLLHNATLPPPVQDPNNTTYPNSPSFAHSMGASNHISVNNMNVSANCDGQNQTASAHHYKMEVPSSVVGPEMMYYPNCSGGSDIQTTDGFLSSLLNDEDLPLMDIPTNEYNGRPIGEFGPSSSYRYLQVEDPHRLVPVAQKKHQMYGKRFFHDQGHGGAAGVGVVSNLASGGSNSNGTMPLVGSFPSPYTPGVPQSHMEASGVSMNMPEMKYSCALDFRPDISEGAINPVQHNHTYHMPSDGPSGINRPHSKDRRGRRSEVEKHMSRDEKRALALNLPISCDDIINLPMDEFNERISKYDLTEAQLSLIRDIRRRGKNKVAAQNCRKRKLDQIIHLAEEVKVIHYRKSDVQNHVERLKTERNRLKHKFSLLYRHIFQALRDADGNPYSMHEFVLEQTADGNIVLMPRGGPSSEFNSPSSSHGHNETELH